MSDDIRSVIAAQAAKAIDEKKWTQLRYIGNRFERARCYKDCWFALAQASEATTHHQLPIWPGPEVRCGGVLVLPTTRDLGDELRILRFIGDLKEHIAHVIVSTDPRLHPLIERSFPGVICCDPARIPNRAERTPCLSGSGTYVLTASQFTRSSSRGPTF